MVLRRAHPCPPPPPPAPPSRRRRGGRERLGAGIRQGQERLALENAQDKGATFPTVDEIPVVAPVDVASLPEDVRAYRQERAKNWPGRAREEARDEKDAETVAAAEAEEAERKARRRARLAEVLAEQRRLGHFEASEEIGELVGGGPGDTADRPGDRRKRPGRRRRRAAAATATRTTRPWGPTRLDRRRVRPRSRQGRSPRRSGDAGTGTGTDGDVPRRPREKRARVGSERGVGRGAVRV